MLVKLFGFDFKIIWFMLLLIVAEKLHVVVCFSEISCLDIYRWIGRG